METGNISFALNVHPSEASIGSFYCKLLIQNLMKVTSPPNTKHYIQFDSIQTSSEVSHWNYLAERIPSLILSETNFCAIGTGEDQFSCLFSRDGLVYKTLQLIFRSLPKNSVVNASCAEINSGKIRDMSLEQESRPELKLVESQGSTHIEGISIVDIKDPEDIYEAIKEPGVNSYIILSILISYKTEVKTKSSKLVFASTPTFPDANLKQVLAELNLRHKRVPFVNVPYSSSRFTKVLQNILKRNTETFLLVNLNPDRKQETYRLIQFLAGIADMEKETMITLYKKNKIKSERTVQKLERETEKLRVNLKIAHETYNAKLAKLSKLLDMDIEEILKGTYNQIEFKDAEICMRNLRETYRKLRGKERKMKKTKRKIKASLKSKDLNNQVELDEKSKKNSQLRMQIMMIKTNFNSDRVRVLENDLIRSHLDLEEQSVGLFSQRTKTNPTIKVAEEQSFPNKHLFLKNKNEMNNELLKLEDQYKKSLQEKDETLRRASDSIQKKERELNLEVSEIKEETKHLKTFLTKNRQIIEQLKSKSYSKISNRRANSSGIPINTELANDEKLMTEIQQYRNKLSIIYKQISQLRNSKGRFETLNKEKNQWKDAYSTIMKAKFPQSKLPRLNLQAILNKHIQSSVKVQRIVVPKSHRESIETSRPADKLGRYKSKSSRQLQQSPSLNY